MNSLAGGLALAALLALGVLGIGRAFMLGLRGVLVVPIDRERRPHEALADLVFLLSFLLWIYEVVAFAWPLDLHLAGGALSNIAVDSTLARVVGTGLLLGGLVAYWLALQAFGPSWRLTIDRERAGELVTRGIFAHTRNPIYLSLSLLAAGSFLLLGGLSLLVLTVVFVAYFAHLIVREERFLRAHYGAPYIQYCQRVGRVWTFRRIARTGGA